MDKGDKSAVIRQLGESVRQSGIDAWRRAWPALLSLWAVARPVLRSSLEFLLALLIVFEEWGWRSLADLLGRLARWRLWAGIEARIIRLPPYSALVVFALPSLLLLPLKFLALLLVGGGHFFLAGLLFAAAKVGATALIARLFMLTQPALMQIGWFASTYDTLMPWKEALVARVHASWGWRLGRLWKARTLQFMRIHWMRFLPVALALRAWVRAAAGKLAASGRAQFGNAKRWLGRAVSR